MADPVAGVEKIVKIGLKIKEAVDTVRHNEEECREIRKRVLRFSAILSQLQQTGLMNDSPALSGALEDLEESLQHALELVTACQERSTIRRLIKAGDLSKQLHRVKDDILNKVMLASFAVNTQATIVLLTIQAAGGHPPPRQPEDAGVVDSTDDARTELNDVENSVIAGSEVPLAPLSVAIREFRWSELMAATNSFSYGNTIARGGSFVIYKGVLKGGNIVAIKRCHKTIDDYNVWLQDEYYDLLPVVSKLQHENIVKFVGYCEVLEQPIETEFLWVEEYVANGSLQDIIHDSRIHWSSLFQIIQGIAQGLHYLHEQRVVHMDVKPLNILLDSDMNPKITDFELWDMQLRNISKLVFYLQRMMFMLLASPFLRLLAVCADLNHRKAYIDGEAWKAELMKEEFDPALFEASDLEQIRRCIQIGLVCAQLDRARRPNMDQVLEMLNGNKKLPNTKWRLLAWF
ncbi:hypothetical protein SETIT_8G226800v2 [Setaria italica]|uniref:non-specific serine/threonine protein kinase n=1 Tax=Setaria italica TaxID=4555 RepID=A0A368SCA1_SETIT|nr:putative receptor-like protein kinase At4g00960 isoform X2 [Setaria italica]RCV39460.1 hypothetical protein SETIT_8G226800v2 [Setaria italica]